MKRIKAYSPILILGLSQWSKYVSRMPVMKSLKKHIQIRKDDESDTKTNEN